MKKMMLSLLMGVMLLSGSVAFGTNVQARGPQLDPVTRSGTKDCKLGTVRLFTLTHSAYFVPNNLGTQCYVQDHKVGAKNVNSNLDGAVVVSKKTENDGFTAVARGVASYKGDTKTYYHRLYY